MVYNSYMKRIVFVITAFMLLLIASVLLFFYSRKTPPVPQQSVVTPTSTPPIESPRFSIVARNLEVPWGLVFLPDGRLLVTERKGLVKIIEKDKSVKKVAEIEVKQTGESGLHGITVHPDFKTNHFVYVYHTYEATGNNTNNRVVRYTFENDTFKDPKILVDKIPGAIFHDGGRIKFGPDKMLYITTGDARNPSLAQNLNSLAGKILRVTDTGDIPLDNPLVKVTQITSDKRVYSYGHRNPQGIAWDSNGNLWETEHGDNNGMDEINRIEPAKNYGWPASLGYQTFAGNRPAILHSGQEITWAPAGASFINDSLFFGGLRGQALFEYNITTKQLTEHFKEEFGRIRDVVVGPDGMLYITTSNKDGRGSPQKEDDRIIRINPEKL